MRKRVEEISGLILTTWQFEKWTVFLTESSRHNPFASLVRCKKRFHTRWISVSLNWAGNLWKTKHFHAQWQWGSGKMSSLIVSKIVQRFSTISEEVNWNMMVQVDGKNAGTILVYPYHSKEEIVIKAILHADDKLGKRVVVKTFLVGRKLVNLITE